MSELLAPWLVPWAVGHFKECNINKSMYRTGECNCKELSAPDGVFAQRNATRSAEVHLVASKDLTEKDAEVILDIVDLLKEHKRERNKK